MTFNFRFYKSVSLAICVTLATTPYAMAQGDTETVPAGYFALNEGVTLITGETWKDKNQTYRLYGIQSCLRGSTFTNASGVKNDCGDVSLAVFAAYIKDTKPLCAPVAKTPELTYVSCYSMVGNDRLDLANILVTQGFAFASINQDGLPVHPPYLVSEQIAAEKKAGLWAYKDVQHPSVFLAQEWNKRNK